MKKQQLSKTEPDHYIIDWENDVPDFHLFIEEHHNFIFHQFVFTQKESDTLLHSQVLFLIEDAEYIYKDFNGTWYHGNILKLKESRREMYKAYMEYSKWHQQQKTEIKKLFEKYDR